ncbi:SUMF1/EgtB/PvdO family nonheme iron enzyme [Marinobacterium arenosum]|uniref:SUMF1/EgtB/PvdO family nonheme iron enzyme n=1 Tax=Marinobacterium arenosum TaxID=2862496 RepID=UPI001C938AA0|nr:SUMF1/EgtB/PvdO family nonheme iron enzyme [Marinobacterium arenosum]MBY4676657.1 SUMF1/EgtB/PvdO family nonheme iron enzyme [Marinobacterium arenosum]
MDQTQDNPTSILKEGLLLGPGRHFKLQSEVASLSLGRLWKVSDLGPGSRTTLSLLFVDPLLVAHSSFLNTLKRQLNDAKRVKHPHLADLQGFFQLRNGLLAVTCEPLDGLSLQRLIEQGDARKLKQGQLKGLLLQLATVLDFLHKRHGSPHGALCPELVFINRGSGIKLLGQGLRTTLDSCNDNLPQPLSYPQYQAPEAIHPGNVRASADVFSLACIAYQLLTGELPFRLDDNGQRQGMPDKQPRNLSDRQWLTLQRALSANPDNRPLSATALIQALFVEEAEEPADQAQPNAAADPTSNTALSDSSPPAASDNHSDTSQTTKKYRLPGWLNLPRLNRPLVFAGGFICGFLLALALGQYWLADRHSTRERLAGQSSTPPAPTTGSATQPTAQQDNAANIEALQQQIAQQAEAREAAKETNPQSSDLAEPQRNSQTLFRDQIDGDTYGPEMVVIPAGEFIKGDDSRQADDNERPAHRIHIQRAFGLSRYEVTFDEYDLFAKDSGRPLPDDEGWGRGRRPVINVSWHDAQAYARWLGLVTGQPYRLPTESEWEYAARAGSQTRYWWGDELLQGYAVCDECGSRWDGQQSAPVGSMKPNPWGLYDMAGNVDEWVADCYADNYSATPRDGSAWQNGDCSERAMRGGSWFDIGRLMRPSSRYRNPASGSRNSWGFRVALDINPRTTEN